MCCLTSVSNKEISSKKTKFKRNHCFNDFTIDSFKNDDDGLSFEIQKRREIGAAKLEIIILC